MSQMLDGRWYAPEPVPAPASLQFLWPCFESHATSTHLTEMQTCIFKMSAWKPKTQAVPPSARKIRSWQKALKNQQIIIRQKYKTRMNFKTFYLFFHAELFSFHIYFQWQCNIFQCFLVQGLFSVFPHQISAICWFALKNLCFPLSEVPALPPAVRLHSVQKFLDEFPAEWSTMEE